MKIKITKALFVFAVAFVSFLSLTDSAEAYWQCNEPRKWNSDYNYAFNWDYQTRGEIIRFRASAPSYWGDNCAVGCPDPAGCGSCECRCAGNDLYCADIWMWTSQGNPRKAYQTCSWNLISSYDSRCVPSDHSIRSPINGSSYEVGSNIPFEGRAKDGNEEDLTFRWIIRTVSNNNAANYSQDIRVTETEDGDSGYIYNSFDKNDLPVEDYYAFLAVSNKQGAYAKNASGGDWKYVRFDVKKTASCGTRNTTYSSSETTWPVGSSWCGPGISGSSLPGFPDQGQTVSWNCLGQNGGSNANCSATRNAPAAVTASCGSRAINYGYNEITWRPGSTWCSPSNSPAANLPAFPDQGQQVSWVCGGQNGGSDSPTCYASRSNPPQPIPGACNLLNNLGANETAWPGIAKCESDADRFSRFIALPGMRDYFIATCMSPYFCRDGLLSPPVVPIFPDQGQQASWVCGGQNGADSSPICAVSRLEPCVDGCNPQDPGQVACTGDEASCTTCSTKSECQGKTRTVRTYTPNCAGGPKCENVDIIDDSTCTCDGQDISNWIEVPAN